MISLVIPIYNEADLIDELIERSVAALKGIGEPFELIIVDDGSEDDSLKMLLDHRKKDHRIKVIELSRNFGHQAAFTAGLSKSKGEYTVMMDGDLQDVPELIGEMYAKMKSGAYDIINGYRKSRTDKGFRKWMFYFFHKIFSIISGQKNVENIGNFSMLNRAALNALLQMKEKTRYLPGLRMYVGYKQGFLDYAREDRKEGDAKMRFRHLIKLAMDAIFSFSRLPIFICFYLGLFGAIVFLVLGIIVVYSDNDAVFMDIKPLLIGIYFFGSIQLAFIGILGEYVFKGYKESQNRPMYFVRNEFIEE